MAKRKIHVLTHEFHAMSRGFAIGLLVGFMLAALLFSTAVTV